MVMVFAIVAGIVLFAIYFCLCGYFAMNWWWVSLFNRWFIMVF